MSIYLVVICVHSRICFGPPLSLFVHRAKLQWTQQGVSHRCMLDVLTHELKHTHNSFISDQILIRFHVLSCHYADFLSAQSAVTCDNWNAHADIKTWQMCKKRKPTGDRAANRSFWRGRDCFSGNPCEVMGQQGPQRLKRGSEMYAGLKQSSHKSFTMQIMMHYSHKAPHGGLTMLIPIKTSLQATATNKHTLIGLLKNETLDFSVLSHGGPWILHVNQR